MSERVQQQVDQSGGAAVVVELRTGVSTAPAPDATAERGRRSALGRAAQSFVDRLPGGATTHRPTARASRYVPVHVDADGLDALRDDPAVASISLNGQRKLSLATGTKAVGAPVAWASGFTGEGQTVAIIDSGVQRNHPFLNGRVVNEVCFSDGNGEPLSTGLCTGGDPTFAEGVGAAAPCVGIDGCEHGTHVAGIAAGANGSAQAPSGVAPGADIVALKVFSRVSGTACSPFPSPCVTAWDVDVLDALDWVNSHRITDNIVAANISLGGGSDPGNCDAEWPDYASIINTLRANGVVTTIASGNDGLINAMSIPACISGAVSVGAIATNDLSVAWFSNASPTLDMVAPGARTAATPANTVGLTSSVPTSTYGQIPGTSMAAPHVAGAWALMQQAYPGISVDFAEFILKSTGRLVQDVNAVFPLMQLDEALPKPKGTYHPVAPTRLLDTREGNGAPKAKVGAAKTIDVQIGGRGGVPSSGVSAVVLNVTYVGPTSGGFVTVSPFGVPRPNASNLNLSPGDARPNLVTVRMGAAGKVSFYNEIGAVDLVADVAGWYDDDPDNTGSYFHSASPVRVLDTRNGTGAPQAKLGQGGKLTLDMDSVAGTPVPDGATAVVVNLTGGGATAGTFVTAYPADLVNPPLASNLNVSPGQTRPNLAIVPLDADGELTLYNNLGFVDLILDVQGWYDDTPGYRFVPKSPTRILDSRFGNGRSGPLGSNATFDLQVTGRGNIPSNGVTGVVMNVTSTGVTAGGFVTVYPPAAQPPLASNLNLEVGKDVPNLVTTALPANGRARFYNKVGSVHLIGDVAGWFEA